MKHLLLEIGTEELPASFLKPAATELERRVRALLDEHGITAGPSVIFFAPRRLAVRFADVPVEKPAAVVEMQGPPKKAAFDAEGRPTRTAIGFSAAQGAKPEDLYVKITPRGEYVFVRKQTAAVPTAQVLAAGLAGVITSLPFAKSMRWTEGKLTFARPIRWLCCILGSDTVNFGLDRLTSGNATRGHRNFAPGPVPVPAPDQYESVLEASRVIADHATRRRMILENLERLASEVGGAVVPDDELVEETADITEYPELIRCGFKPEYLDLPADILITALKKHQRCFSVQKPDRTGLLPCFIAVTNTPGCNHATVGGWYEKAAESRLKDARFFVQADLVHGLAPLVKEEKRVTWIEGMGSYSDKTERLRELCKHLVGALKLDANTAATLDRAAQLCKADLLTNMVREKEFTSLQGRIGGIYARLLGEPEPVATAIAEHYLPNFSGDVLPQSQAGALLSIADKTDNIVATFLTGAIPSGSEDPFALRRQAIGLLAVMTARDLPIDLGTLLSTALDLFPGHKPELAAQLPGFLRERVAALIADSGIAYDIAAAVLETGWHQPVLAITRARALALFRSQPEFEKLIAGQKRVANILRKEKVEGLPDEGLMTDEAEKLLWQQAHAAAPGIDKALAAHEYDKAFAALLGLRPIIDRFFTDVLVMDKDPAVKTNRLRLLAYVRSLFARVADLSKIVIEGETA